MLLSNTWQLVGDKNCSMHRLGDDMKKHGFLSGYALAKKEYTGKGV